MLLGAEFFWDLLENEKIKIPGSDLFLLNTKLGYVIGGATYNSLLIEQVKFCNVSIKTSNDELKQLLTRFWEQEELTHVQEKKWTKEELECEEQFVDTHLRDNTGRFIIELPLKNGKVDLGNSSDTALKRLFGLERKFRKDPEFKADYRAAITEMIQSGILQEISESELNNITDAFYLPHSAVIKPTSSSTKLRVVFDGSAKSSNGYSLNDNLMTGPNLQNDPFQLLIKFRQHQVALCADMTKMFLQIRISDKHADLQRIFWRYSETDPVKTYRLTRLVFGLTNSPYSAMRCVRQIASESAEEYPTASRVLQDDIYMDDVLTGAETSEDAVVLRNNLIEILNRGCFALTKWKSNDIQVLPGDDHKNSDLLLRTGSSQFNATKILGLSWNPQTDTFHYHYQKFDLAENVTKRQVLSVIARLFDPIGLVAPIVVRAKIIMQELCRLKLEWDDPIPGDILKAWSSFVNDLASLDELAIPRKILPSSTNEVQLIAFADASLKAYGAVIYLRSFANGEFVTRLVCSKSRVSPIKSLTLPRLELCAAVLAANLMHKVSTCLKLDHCEKMYFSDSMIVLHYINSTANSWQVFVAHRVSQIQSLSEAKDWFYVQTKDNPADIVSRGASPRQLTRSETYWNGPAFLRNKMEDWPVKKVDTSANVDLPEKRKVVLSVTQDPDLQLFNKYSSYFRTLRITALCKRFIFNLRGRGEKRTGPLTAVEVSEARVTILKSIQRAEFPQTLQYLLSGHPVERSDPLSSLDPFVDETGLIRVGGRLRNAPIMDSQKYPIVLPAKNHITNLLIRVEHLKLLHAGPNQTLASVRLRYWPLRSKIQVRSVLRTCVTCSRVAPKFVYQKMGDIPRERLTPCRAFTNVGLDYFGPFMIKFGNPRSKKLTKAWVALFVCMFSRAVHLEIVGDLTAECFINALKRLVSRRGRVSTIFCDNAKTFVGAKRQLDDIQKFFADPNLLDRLDHFLTEEGITWKFIPPRSPNFGGLWERLVRSAKGHFKKIVQNSILTFEEANTLIIQIEAVMNSRPLCPLSQDPAEHESLTPAHFLIGQSLFAVPEYDVSTEISTRLTRWKRVEQMHQTFWKKWLEEVISLMQTRGKWCHKLPEDLELKIGDLVLISEENLPPLKWKSARVVSLIPGPDSMVRVAEIRASDGTIYKRSVRKLARLPVNDEDCDCDRCSVNVKKGQ